MSLFCSRFGHQAQTSSTFGWAFLLQCSCIRLAFISVNVNVPDCLGQVATAIDTWAVSSVFGDWRDMIVRESDSVHLRSPRCVTLNDLCDTDTWWTVGGSKIEKRRRKKGKTAFCVSGFVVRTKEAKFRFNCRGRYTADLLHNGPWFTAARLSGRRFPFFSRSEALRR